AADILGRITALKLSEALGQQFVVDNRGGAGGTIGTAAVKRAAPDGYTILVSSLGPLVIGPHLMKGVAYDATKDLDYISVAVQAPNVLVVPAASPHKTMADVLAFLKANPAKMSFASSGNGSSDHITAELFWQQTGTSGLHIPYKGGGPVMTDLLGNQVDSSFMNINTALPQIKAGKLRALAVTTRAAGEEVTLSWPHLGRQLPRGYRARLTDPTNGRSVLLSTRAAYSFTASAGERQLELTVEPTRESGLRVLRFQPGPSRGRAISFEVDLTTEAEVFLRVSSLSGRVVAQTPPVTAAGPTALAWDGLDSAGRPVPRGSYQVTLIARTPLGETVRAVRMLTLR
ncbi:MAG: hypothetical protein HUU35_07175, partial [Armatimonadetes bacterium]|nr:hypothetical protein [Armatimonadota bacterium]